MKKLFSEGEERFLLQLTLLMAAVTLCCLQSNASAAAPEVYTQPFLQSPVRAAPDDLLMIPGHGFTAGDIVVYKRLGDTTQPLVPPRRLPRTSTPAKGVAEVVNVTTDNLVIRLPSVMREEQSYALWVRNQHGEWSAGMRINDARPLWFSPPRSFQNAVYAALPRELKIMGRNLQPAPGKKTRVRLSGPRTYVLRAANDHNPDTAIERYVARVPLPTGMPLGEYQVEVSRDGRSWLAVEDQLFTILPDPQPQPQFPVKDYGCLPDDALDDAQCIQDAVDAAAAAGGGAVVFVPGRWLLSEVPDKTWVGGVRHGIVVPPGVSLVGEDASTTTLVRTAGWGTVAGLCEDTPCLQTVFTLLGHNTVTGLHFDDEFPDKNYWFVYFELGRWPSSGAPELIEDITFTNNKFTQMPVAIGGRTFSLRHLAIVKNEFQAYQIGLALSRPVSQDDPNFKNVPFTVEDIVVRYNTFYPGDYFAPEIGQGTMATGIGASRRLDFSENVADGHVNGGWRAAYFWHMSNSHELMLVAQNVATCTGDKAGDGEAIAYDNNKNTPAFPSARSVLAADATTVTVEGPWNDDVAAFPNRYAGYWVQVADGKGVGQVRRIEHYTAGPRIQITVSPPWDVVPDESSKVTVTRQYWQVYVVDNVVDIRSCEKDNPNTTQSGVIGLWAMFADSAVEGNTQYESDGILLGPGYSVEHTRPNGAFLPSFARFIYFTEIRENKVYGELDFDNQNSFSGIRLRYGSDPENPSPVLGYGISISHNTIDHADGMNGGAITIVPGWWRSPTPYQYKSVLIHHNQISDIKRVDANGVCLPFHPPQTDGGVGIHIQEPFTWNTVMYANEMMDVCHELVDHGTNTVVVPSS